MQFEISWEIVQDRDIIVGLSLWAQFPLYPHYMKDQERSSSLKMWTNVDNGEEGKKRGTG